MVHYLINKLFSNTQLISIGKQALTMRDEFRYRSKVIVIPHINKLVNFFHLLDWYELNGSKNRTEGGISACLLHKNQNSTLLSIVLSIETIGSKVNFKEGFQFLKVDLQKQINFKN